MCNDLTIRSRNSQGRLFCPPPVLQLNPSLGCTAIGQDTTKTSMTATPVTLTEPAAAEGMVNDPAHNTSAMPSGDSCTSKSMSAPMSWSSYCQSEYLKHMVSQKGSRFRSVHHRVVGRSNDWFVHHNVVNIAPVCHSCIGYHMDTCDHHGDVVSVRGGGTPGPEFTGGCACNIKILAQQQTEAKTPSEEAPLPAMLGGASQVTPVTPLTTYRADDRPADTELINYWRRVKLATENSFVPLSVIDWDQLANTVTQLFQDCIDTRRHSRWGRVVWRDSNSKLTTAYTSDCYVRKSTAGGRDPRAVLSGVQFLRAVFGRSGLMNELAVHKPTVTEWELTASPRMSLYTGPPHDAEPTNTEQHAYLTSD